MDARSAWAGCVLIGEQVFEFFTIFEIYRDVEIAGDVWLADVELLEQGGEEFAGVEAQLIVLRPTLLAVYKVRGAVRGINSASKLHRSFALLRMTSRVCVPCR